MVARTKKIPDKSNNLQLFEAARRSPDTEDTRRLRNFKRQAEAHLRALTLAYEQIETLQRQMKAVKLPDAKTELDKISNLEGVESFRMERYQLIIRTKPLSAKNLKRDRATFGTFTITIWVPEAKVESIKNDTPVGHNGYLWHHLYTEENGTTCWGNAGDQIAQKGAERDIPGLVAIVIDFLQVGRSSSPVYQMFLLRNKEEKEKKKVKVKK